MRLSDLLTTVALATRGYRAEIPETARLELMRRAFPRPDLLHWFDGLALRDLAPCDYFPMLACAFARAVQLRHAPGRVALAGNPEHAVGRHAPAFAADAVPLGGVPPHEVGLLLAGFATAEDAAGVPALLLTGLPRATTLLLFAAPAWAALEADPWHGRAHFAGELQAWAPSRLYAVALDPVSLDPVP